MMMKKALVGVTLLGVYGCGCEQVDTGYRGIKTEFGKVVGEPLGEGLYFYNPFTSSIEEIEIREQKLETIADCFTKDTQKVKITFVMTYYPDPTRVHLLYQNMGKQWAEKIVLPVTLGAIKDVVGKYAADDLVGKREEARNAAEKEIVETLTARSVIATRVDITHLDFEDAYKHAVEAKAVAIQKAQEAKNKTVEIEERAKQQVIGAQAEAESMRIRSAALSANRGLVEYEIATKWDGALPNVLTITGKEALGQMLNIPMMVLNGK